MTISLTHVAASNHQLHITIKNLTEQILLVSKSQIDVQVSAETHKITTERYHCEYLQGVLINGIEAHIKQNGVDKNWLGFGRHKYLTLAPKQQYSLEISLAELRNNPFFHKKEHDFTITLKLSPQIESSSELCTPSELQICLKWHPMRAEPFPPEPIGQLMLEYRNTTPFYLNVSESSNLPLWITGDGAEAWIKHGAKQSALNGTLAIDWELPEDTQLDATLTQQITQKFDLKSIGVTEHKEELLVTVPIKNPQAKISQDSRATLKLSLSSPTEPKQLLKLDIPVLLQRPSFPGRVTLDFGTTNSAIAYYDPDSGIPTFPERAFSDSQLDKLNQAIEQLLQKVNVKLGNNRRYQVVADQLVQFAKTMWRTDPKGNQVSSVDAIGEHFKDLKRKDTSKKDIGEYQAKLLVSWGNIGYKNLKNSQAPLKVLDFVTQSYLEALDNIIDIDITKDARSELPELDQGQRNGEIPSDIMLRVLSPSTNEKTAENVYKGIAGLSSIIDMGEAVKSNLSLAPTEEYSEQDTPNTPNDGKERHNFYLSGAKRGVGLKDESYFVDMQHQAFLDTYDPLCMSAVKELLTRTEQHINKRRSRRSCLNDLVVTYPANLPQYRRESYRNIIHDLGVARVDMSFDEATAGALYYIWRDLFKDLFAGIDGFLARSRVRQKESKHPVTGRDRLIDFYYQNILLYDMGGGTTDIALIEIGLEQIENLLPPNKANSGRYFVIRPKILGLTGLERFGGDNVTLAVFRIIKSKLAAIVAQLLIDNGNSNHSTDIKQALQAFKLGKESKEERNIFTHWFSEDGDKDYHEKVDIAEPDTNRSIQQRELAELIEALVKTHFDAEPERQSSFFGLWQEAERIKKALSTPQSGYEDVPLPETVSASPAKLFAAIAELELGISEMDLDSITVSLAEMERLIKTDVAKTFEKARNLCIGKKDGEEQYFTKHTIDHLVLAGSSSHLSLVREKMPFAILGVPFEFIKKGQKYQCATPFKYDGDNLQFSPDDAKLAVVRGAALPSYFKTNRIPPQADKIRDLLQDGISFLDFDIDNLRNYMPFTLIYSVGTGKTELFESGAQMDDMSRNGKIATRKVIPETDTFTLYRVDSLVDRDNPTEQQYYAQFPIRDEFIKFYESEHGEKLEKHQDKEKLDELMSRYLFWVEFDIERDMQCFMYTNPDGNDDERYVNELIAPISEQRLEEIKQDLTEYDSNNKLIFKSDITLYCPVGMSGEGFDGIDLILKSATKAVSKDVILGNMGQGTGGDTYFYVAKPPEAAPVWKLNLQDYNIKNTHTFVKPKLHICLSLQQDKLQLTYSVYDPDLTGDNVREIKMTHDSRKAPQPFNPYRGEE